MEQPSSIPPGSSPTSALNQRASPSVAGRLLDVAQRRGAPGGDGDPFEGKGLEGERARVVMRLRLKPRHCLFALPRVRCYSWWWRLLWPRRTCTRLAPGYGRGAGGEISVMGCRRGAGPGRGMWCSQKTSVRVTCGICLGLSILQVCFLWQLHI